MQILYHASIMSNKSFQKMFETKDALLAQQSQKYHQLLISGLVKNDVDLTVVCSLAPYADNTTKVVNKAVKENEGLVRYIYVPFIKIPVIKQLSVTISAFVQAYRIARNNSQCIIVCDVLNIGLSTGALIAAKMAGCICIGIVTDLPGFYYSEKDVLRNAKSVLIQKIMGILISKFDNYVLLTSAMNDIINKKKKPYCVIEGQVDINMDKTNNRMQAKHTNKVILFAGSLDKANGIDILLAAFSKANIEDAELHIYGKGDYVDKVVEAAKENHRIIYFGNVRNDLVVIEQVRATLLINPRPTHEAFTKYSFPSKNMEYMVSGTPILTTKLPGMPKEYLPYIYLIDDETVEGVSKALKEVLEIPLLELHLQGQSAKEFVLKEKNNIMQAAKICDMARKLLEIKNIDDANN